MQAVNSMLKSSYAELKNLRSLTLASLLAAIYAVSYLPLAGRIIIVPGVIEIRFGFIAIAIAGALFGPVTAAIAAFIGDIVGTIMFSGSNFFWGFTLNWVVLGLIFGLIFYKEKVSTGRVVAAMLFNTCIINMILTTTWLAMMGVGEFKTLFVARILPNCVMLPINILILLFVLRGVCSAYKKLIFKQS